MPQLYSFTTELKRFPLFCRQKYRSLNLRRLQTKYIASWFYILNTCLSGFLQEHEEWFHTLNLCRYPEPFTFYLRGGRWKRWWPQPFRRGRRSEDKASRTWANKCSHVMRLKVKSVSACRLKIQSLELEGRNLPRQPQKLTMKMIPPQKMKTIETFSRISEKENFVVISCILIK